MRTPNSIFCLSSSTRLDTWQLRWQPRIEERSPLVAVPFPSILEDTPRTCFEEHGPMGEYNRMVSSFGREAGSKPKSFHI